MAKIKVKNAVNTANQKPKDGSQSWLNYWLNNESNNFFRWVSRIAFLDTQHCSACGGGVAGENSIDGCHVMMAGDNSGQMYIVPLCKACNHRTDAFLVDDELLVPVQ